MTLAVQFQNVLRVEKVPVHFPDHRQVPESQYVETIVDAIELTESDPNSTAHDWTVIRAAIGNVRSTINRESLREMLDRAQGRANARAVGAQKGRW